MGKEIHDNKLEISLINKKMKNKDVNFYIQSIDFQYSKNSIVISKNQPNNKKTAKFDPDNNKLTVTIQAGRHGTHYVVNEIKKDYKKKQMLGNYGKYYPKKLNFFVRGILTVYHKNDATKKQILIILISFLHKAIGISSIIFRKGIIGISRVNISTEITHGQFWKMLGKQKDI